MSFSKVCRFTLPRATQISMVLTRQIHKKCGVHSCTKQCYMTGAVETSKQPEKFHYKPKEELCVDNVSEEGKWLKVRFNNGTIGTAPYVWLRDNCQCSACYSPSVRGRKFLMMNLDLKIHPVKTWQERDILHVNWNDGHHSTYPSEWLHDRNFTESAKKSYVRRYSGKKTLWGEELDLNTFDYYSLINNENQLMKYLITLEGKGVALVKNAPLEEDSGAKLIDHIAFVKPSHFGRRSPVRVRENANNLAWTSSKLGLHTDLTQYDHQAGIIFIHAIQQHQGNGGESVISDGFNCAEILKKNHPEYFKILSTNDVFFWDKGQRTYHLEMESFYKINKGPVIRLGTDGNVEKISVNDQVRDSHMNMSYEKVPEFYEALKTYNDLLYEHSYNFKMENGDIITLDNVRCLHGRESFGNSSDRHVESAYLDWDEARCKRRRLQEKFSS